MIHKLLIAAVVVFAPSACSFATPPTAGVAFNGRSTHAVVEDGSAFNLDHFTLTAWVKLRRTDCSQVFFNRGTAGELFTFYLYHDGIRMLVGQQSGDYTHADGPIPPVDTWKHYAGTYDGQKIKLYVDGRLVDTAPSGPMPDSSAELLIGALMPGSRTVDGELADLRIYRRVLSADEVARVVEAASDGGDVRDGLLTRWTADSLEGETWQNMAGLSLAARYLQKHEIRAKKADGYRGIWYSCQGQDDEYVYKYSGGLGTYCAKHRPFAIYRSEVDKTFFCYGGTNEDGDTLLHMVSYFDHKTDTVPRPTVLLDKRTTDAHDNPVISIDAEGHIWIFSSSHGTARPSYLSRSVEPYSIDKFELVLTTNFSYTQPFYLDGKGFAFPQTIYRGGRAFYFQTSPDGSQWTEPKLLSLIHQGHYEISEPFKTEKIGSAFNYHPQPKGLNWRTNLYYIETSDFGKTWQSVDGETLELPLTEPDNPALVAEYESRNRNVYMKDITFDNQGNPVILFVTSGGWESGPANDPRIWQTARWTGSQWEVTGSIASDNNYDMGSLYVEDDGTWRLIAPTETGPQPYNPGGEVAMWTSRDQGHTWQKIKQLTHESPFNHTYVRRPVNAHPDFYALWADGHARQKSESRLYFTNRKGDHVWRLPQTIEGQVAKPEIAW